MLYCIQKSEICTFMGFSIYCSGQNTNRKAREVKESKNKEYLKIKGWRQSDFSCLAVK